MSTISPIAPEDRRSERREQTPRARRDRAEALVDLEQHRRPRRRPDPRVRLDQLALTTVERVLGAAEVAHLHLRPALAQEPPLAGVERVAAADLGRVVRVEDAPVRRPDLHPHDRVAQHARDDDVVHGSQRGRLAREQTVAEGRLDELPRLLHLRPRLALRLVDRDGAEREIAADDGHGDRGRAPERKAQRAPSARSADDCRRGDALSRAAAPSAPIIAARTGVREGSPGPMSHCRPDRRSRGSVSSPMRGAPMFNFRVITLAAALAVSVAALAVAPLASAKGGHGVRVQRHLHQELDRQAQAEPRGRPHRGRVRGRPESQRRSLEGHAAPERIARRLDDRNHPRPQRLVLPPPRDLRRARNRRRRSDPRSGERCTAQAGI